MAADAWEVVLRRHHELSSIASPRRAYFFCLLGVFNLVQPLLFCTALIYS